MDKLYILYTSISLKNLLHKNRNKSARKKSKNDVIKRSIQFSVNRTKTAEYAEAVRKQWSRNVSTALYFIFRTNADSSWLSAFHQYAQSVNKQNLNIHFHTDSFFPPIIRNVSSYKSSGEAFPCLYITLLLQCT